MSFKPISPNPVTSNTAKVDFGIGIKAPTVIEVIDLEGRVVSRLVDQTLNVGEYTLEFPTSNLGNGVYMLRIQCLDYTETQRVVIAK
jgi:5-hydroxyisourate hydrolase-like protein (transthyretin family)